jgi:hypothetical protein
MDPVETRERNLRQAERLDRERRLREQEQSRRRLREAERELRERPPSGLGKRLRERAAREARRMDVLIGLDLGQLRDPTALCVAEVVARPTGRITETDLHDGSLWREPERETAYRVRHVERLPLRTPFRQVGRRVADMVETLQVYAEEKDRDLRLYVLGDATGLGRPAIEQVREEVGTRIPVSMVTVTSGEGLTGSLGSSEVKVSKTYLVTRTAALLQRGLVEFPGTPEAALLADELRSFTIRATRRGLQAEAERTGEGHGDLAFALMLAVLFDPQLRLALSTGRRLFK